MIPDPVFTAPELAEYLPISNQSVNSRLNRFEDEGLVESKSVGAAAKVYWLTPKGRNQLAEVLSEWR